jgi:hypothetical protein
MNLVELLYQRDGTTYSGYIRYKEVSSLFSNYSFAQIIRELHLFLVDHPEVEDVDFRRGETTTKFGHKLGPQTVSMIRSDPVSVIKEMSPPPRTIDLRKSEQQEPRDTEPSSSVASTLISNGSALRIGSDTLADAFGDFVYLRRRKNIVECPFCGRWQAIIPCDHSVIKCSCRFFVPGTALERPGKEVGWFRVRMTCLFASHAPRFFLPLSWNISGPWIKHEDLLHLYEEYKKERQQCLDQVMGSVPQE